jgi:hypothetical protein
MMGHIEHFSVFAGPDPSGHADLLKLVSAAVVYVDKRVDELAAQRERELKAIAPADLLKLQDARIVRLDPTQLGWSRGELQRRLEKLKTSSTEETD